MALSSLKTLSSASRRSIVSRAARGSWHPDCVLTRQRDLEPASHRPPVDADPVILWRGTAPGAAGEKVAPARPPAAFAGGYGEPAVALRRREPRRSSRFRERFGLPAP